MCRISHFFLEKLPYWSQWGQILLKFLKSCKTCHFWLSFLAVLATKVCVKGYAGGGDKYATLGGMLCGGGQGICMIIKNALASHHNNVFWHCQNGENLNVSITLQDAKHLSCVSVTTLRGQSSNVAEKSRSSLCVYWWLTFKFTPCSKACFINRQAVTAEPSDAALHSYFGYRRHMPHAYATIMQFFSFGQHVPRLTQVETQFWPKPRCFLKIQA